MSGIDEAAGGVDSASKSNSTKNATNIFIPEDRKKSNFNPLIIHLVWS